MHVVEQQLTKTWVEATAAEAMRGFSQVKLAVDADAIFHAVRQAATYLDAVRIPCDSAGQAERVLGILQNADDAYVYG